MDNARTILIGGAATLIIIGGLVYTQLDNWFDTNPDSSGPGSGDELPYEPEGPGSGDELPYEPEGPGSGDELPYEPEGPGSGDELPYEPEGPGSGDELPYEPEPTGPGSGDELPPDDEPTGPGSGDEYSVVGSCNDINFGSTCVDYIGSFWKTIESSINSCSNVGTWSDDPCPTNYQGGCNMNTGTAQEMTIWNYNYGGDPFGPAAIQAVSSGCNMSPFGSWILGN